MALFVLFDYFNHKGENTPGRRVRPTGFFHGKTVWFPDVHSYLEGTDLPRGVTRSFAIDRMFNIRMVEQDEAKDPASMTVAELVCHDIKRQTLVGTEGLKADLAGLRLSGLNLTEAYLAAIALAVNLRREIELRKSGA